MCMCIFSDINCIYVLFLISRHIDISVLDNPIVEEQNVQHQESDKSYVEACNGPLYQNQLDCPDIYKKYVRQFEGWL